MAHSGWPIKRSDLDEYYLRAQSILELGEFHYDNLEILLDSTGLKALTLDESRLKTAHYGQSPPTRFGQRYRDDLQKAENIEVYLNANALELLADTTASNIETINVINNADSQFNVRAKNFVVATGGLENARLLLLSNNVATNGLGNDHDLVGRYFMDHILLRPGLDVSFTHPGLDLRLYHALHEFSGGKRFAIVAVSEQRLRKEQLTNFRIHLYPTGPRYQTPIGGIFSDLDGYTHPNPLEKARNNSIAMHMVLEPVPNPDSRVTLSKTNFDALGQPTIEVNWQLEKIDLQHAYRAMELMALEFGRLGLGRGYSELFRNKNRWPAHTEAGKHHCGTTRMADSPESGVVDSNCQVFGIDNLFIAGSSVFPTIGYANPTLSIVALAVRLSDHLKAQLR